MGNKKKTYVIPNRSLHLSGRDLGETATLHPSKGFSPNGVSFAPTVRNALEGIPFYYTKTKDWDRRRQFVREGDEFIVYTPIEKQPAIIPETIDDYKRTRERRVLDEVRVRKLGRIRVSVGNNRWKYRWLKPSEINTVQKPPSQKLASLAITDLPFKIKRLGTPKIIHKKSWRAGYRGEQRPDGEYDPKLDAIVFYGSKPPPQSLQEHELAHYQLGFGRDKTLLTTEDMAEQEIQADLLVYAKTKKPPYCDVPLPYYMNENARGLNSDTKHYAFGLYTLWRDLYDRIDAFKGTRSNKMEAVRQSIESAIKKYWRYLPSDWKRAYEISDQLMRKTVQRAEKSQPTIRLAYTKAQASLTQPRIRIRKVEVHRGIAYADKNQKRLSRRHHRGWKRMRFE